MAAYKYAYGKTKEKGNHMYDNKMKKRDRLQII